ncbi:NF-kappa-B inhibitor zeta isoform X1 [Chiloscyllium plagiosum]|uniref:NF-kappa-B inhibitor zeta isoform X1 n=1 Tax=Chiloscyllium plagiosum TaxID=36176 RepID=UPI001CB83774|nr:NF-kappa-B inhibitor zeta isoform X1 [Chiloscyllium plagiosum]
MILDRGSENSSDPESCVMSSPMNLGYFYQSSPAASEPRSPPTPTSPGSDSDTQSGAHSEKGFGSVQSTVYSDTRRSQRRPFQGVRVKNPVKELLNHFRSSRRSNSVEQYQPQLNSAEEQFSQIRSLLSGVKRSAVENLSDAPPYKQSPVLSSPYLLTPPQTPNSVDISDGGHKTETSNDVNPDTLQDIIKMLQNDTQPISLNTVQVSWANVAKNDQVFQANSYIPELQQNELSPGQCQDMQQFHVHSPPQVTRQHEGFQPFHSVDQSSNFQPVLPNGSLPDTQQVSNEFTQSMFSYSEHPHTPLSEGYPIPQGQPMGSQPSSEFYIPGCRSLQPTIQEDISHPASMYYASQSQGKSFFQWQIEQEEKKLSHLTQEQLLSKDSDGDTLLHIAVAQGRRALAYVLGKKMAAINMMDIKEHNGQSALQVAVAANQHLIVEDLVSLGAQVNTSDRWGRTPLHVVAEKGFVQVLMAIEKGMARNCHHLNLEVTNFDGMTALHCAVQTQNRVLRELQNKIHQRLSVEVQEMSIQNKNLLETIKMLLQMGASIETRDRKSGRTALHLAAEEANVDILRFFLDQPTSLNVVNTKAYNGNTALHVAAGMQDRVSQVDAVRLLMRKGADPSARNLENEQPVHLVPDGARGEEVKRILKGKAVQSRMPLF